MKYLFVGLLCIQVVVIGPNEVSPSPSWFTPTKSVENEAYRQQKCAEYNIICSREDVNVRRPNTTP